MRLVTKPREPIQTRMQRAIESALEQEYELDYFLLTPKEAFELARSLDIDPDKIKTGCEYMGVPVKVTEK